MDHDRPAGCDRRRVISEANAAAYCDCAVITFRRMRKSATGPRWIRLSPRRLGYRMSDLDAWLDARTVDGGEA